MVRLKKSLGQHLLVAPGILKKIAELGEIREGDSVVEIGPGTGLLTKEILKYPLKRLYLIEIDKEMVNYLKRYIQDERVVIIEDSATSFNYEKFKENSLKIMGNLPYQVASLIVENIIYYYFLIPLVLILVQKEVAEKWISGKSWLSLFIQTFYSLEYLMTIPPRFFKPPPKVQSSLLKFTFSPKAEIQDLKDYKKFLTKLYTNKRKILEKKVERFLLRRVGIQEKTRIEELSLKEILSLYFLWQDFQNNSF